MGKWQIKGPLHQMLERILPDFRTPTGAFDVAGLADEVGLTSECVYKWLRSNKLRRVRALQIIEIANRNQRAPVVQETDFLPFLA